VAKGYNQKEGEDSFDTYSLVVRLTIIRVLLSLIDSHGLLIYQMYVKTTFLKGKFLISPSKEFEFLISPTNF
jgi:hypothetical protein